MKASDSFTDGHFDTSDTEKTKNTDVFNGGEIIAAISWGSIQPMLPQKVSVQKGTPRPRNTLEPTFASLRFALKVPTFLSAFKNSQERI